MAFPAPFYKWRPHPWHGLEAGKNPPSLIHAYIEITPFDSVKYEVDKTTGYLKVDRPHRTSSQPPVLYGFIPRTFCGERVGKLSPTASRGDHDPLDICVLSERPIDKSEIILNAKVVGGFQMIDHDEADDKIIAVLENDNIWGKADNLDDIPSALVERMRHYFLTYKLVPGQESRTSIEQIYDKAHAIKVVEAALQDYTEEYGN